MPSAKALLPGPRNGFPAGFTAVTQAYGATPAAVPGLEIDFAIFKPGPGEHFSELHSGESAWVLLRGRAELECGGERTTVQRDGVFDEPPTVLHVAGGTHVSVRNLSDDTEWAVVHTRNERTFSPRLYLPSDLVPEYRGSGLVQNAALRNVRLIFDRTTRPESNLVLGEVVNFPGRWSSYPPHHHDQPEIYHYRFTAPQGYGHAELGEQVVKVRDGDTVIIPPGLDHAQVSAPGYGMYYLWIIRHLPDNPYTGFTFAEEHKWTIDPARQGWRPTNPPPGLA